MSIDERMRFDPIGRVDLQTYARVTAVLLTRGVNGIEADAVVVAFGIGADDWLAAREGWSRRIANDEEVRDAYAEYYRNARRRDA